MRICLVYIWDSVSNFYFAVMGWAFCGPSWWIPCPDLVHFLACFEWFGIFLGVFWVIYLLACFWLEVSHLASKMIYQIIEANMCVTYARAISLVCNLCVLFFENIYHLIFMLWDVWGEPMVLSRLFVWKSLDEYFGAPINFLYSLFSSSLLGSLYYVLLLFGLFWRSFGDCWCIVWMSFYFVCPSCLPPSSL